MSRENTRLKTLTKSYALALLGTLLITSINAVYDLRSQYNVNDFGYIIRFHFLSALAYAIPVSLAVYYVIRSQNRNAQTQKFVQIIVYFLSITIGAISGSVVMLYIVFGNDGSTGLEGIPVLIAGYIIGAVVFTLCTFVVRRYLKNNKLK